MSLLSYLEILPLIESGVITAPHENINSTSVEVTLGSNFYLEQFEPWIIDETTKAVDLFTDLANKQNIPLRRVSLNPGEMLVLRPGQFALAETVEQFNLPDDVVAEYVLKSSQARNAWGHLLAGYCDPGWHGSKLTMEFVNHSQFEPLVLTPGQKCGQMKLYRVAEVPADKSYRVVGQYNHQQGVQVSKGIR